MLLLRIWIAETAHGLRLYQQQPMQRLSFVLSLLVLGGVSASADVLLNQPLLFSDGRTSQVFGPNNGFLTWDRIQVAQNSYVHEVSWVGGFFGGGGAQPPTPGADTWTFRVASDNGGVPGAITDTLTVPFADASLQFLGNGTLGGSPAGFYRLHVTLPVSLFLSGGSPQWFTIFAAGSGPSAFAWISGSGGDGVSKQLYLGNGVYSNYTDRAMTLSGTAAVPEPSEFLLLSGVGAALGLGARLRRFTTRA